MAGAAAALAIIPEAISFSILAGVNPQVSLSASFTLVVTIAFVIAPVVKEHDLDYLIATVLLAGLLQIVFSIAGAAKLMRFLPRSDMVGFANALAIVIFMAQIPELVGVPLVEYPMVVVPYVILTKGYLNTSVIRFYLHQGIQAHQAYEYNL